MSKTIFTACLGTETNSFSPIPTGLGLFERTMLLRNGDYGSEPFAFALPLIRWRERGQALGWTVTCSVAAFASPAGNTTRATFEALRDEILSDLEKAMPVDAVLLNLHGAMIADGYPDAEGDLLAAVRALVGPAVPILAELDLHGHMTEQKMAAADALVYFKEYPHIDVLARAEEVFDIAVGMLEGRLRPTMAMHDCKMLGIFPTTREPMKTVVASLQELEQTAGVLSASLVHGFPWGDTPEVGMRVLVVTDDNPELAQQHAREIGERVFAQRNELMAPFVSLSDAINQVVSAPSDGRPFVLADMADNSGIGAASDSTFVLQALLDGGHGGFAISPLWDPVAVELAFDAGIGARLDMRIGGKLGPASGDAVDVSVTVMGLARNASQDFGDAVAPLGNMAWLRVGENPDNDAEAIDIMINTNRTQAFSTSCFTAPGLSIDRPRALVLKSTQHFHAGFAPIARDVIYMKTPGSASMEMASLNHTLVTRPLWPNVENPFL